MIDNQYIKWMISWIEHNLAGDLNAVLVEDFLAHFQLVVGSSAQEAKEGGLMMSTPFGDGRF